MVYIRTIKDMHDEVRTQLRPLERDSKHFLAEMGLHKGFVLCHFLFVLLMNEFMRYILEDDVWCMLFAD